MPSMFLYDKRSILLERQNAKLSTLLMPELKTIKIFSNKPLIVFYCLRAGVMFQSNKEHLFSLKK